MPLFLVVMKRKLSVACRRSQSCCMRLSRQARMRPTIFSSYNLAKASRCMMLPRMLLVSRSSSFQLTGYSTSRGPTGLKVDITSEGFAKRTLPLPTAGRALRNSRILLSSGWYMPIAESSIIMFTTSSPSGREAIQPTYLSAISGYSCHVLLLNLRLTSSLSL